MPFSGTSTHALDAKHRLTVPARHRGELGSAVMLVPSPQDGCIQVWPAAAYTAIAEQALARVNPLSPDGRALRRLLFGTSEAVELDAAGRIGIPQHHLEHAGLSKEVVIVGVQDSLELWSPSGHDDYRDGLTARAAELTESLGHPA